MSNHYKIIGFPTHPPRSKKKSLSSFQNIIPFYLRERKEIFTYLEGRLFSEWRNQNIPYVRKYRRFRLLHLISMYMYLCHTKSGSPTEILIEQFRPAKCSSFPFCTDSRLPAGLKCERIFDIPEISPMTINLESNVSLEPNFLRSNYWISNYVI